MATPEMAIHVIFQLADGVREAIMQDVMPEALLAHWEGVFDVCSIVRVQSHIHVQWPRLWESLLRAPLKPCWDHFRA